jgi:hypothetical protein
MSKSQLPKRKWSEDMTRERVRTHGFANTQKSAKAVVKPKRAKARGEDFALKLRKLRKWPPSGRPKAAKVTDPPRRPLNCESDPPLKTPLSPRACVLYSCSHERSERRCGRGPALGDKDVAISRFRPRAHLYAYSYPPNDPTHSFMSRWDRIGALRV